MINEPNPAGSNDAVDPMATDAGFHATDLPNNETLPVEDGCRTPTLAAFRDFLHRAAAGEMHPVRTGCAAIDDHLHGGIRAELTVLMAEPGAGKTTLCMSMFPYFAAAQRDVLFISLDLTKENVLGKIASRLSYSLRDRREALQYYDIANLTNDDMDYIDELVAAYTAEASYTTICDRSQIKTFSDLEREIDMRCRGADQPPVVIIDYVQVLAALEGSVSERDGVDKAIAFCRYIVAHYHTPMILISSVARSAYGKNLSLSSCKETGSIEYSADCLIGLQRDHEVEKILTGNERPIKLKFFKTRFSEDKAEYELRMLPQYNLYLFDKPINAETSPEDKPSDDEYTLV